MLALITVFILSTRCVIFGWDIKYVLFQGNDIASLGVVILNVKFYEPYKMTLRLSQGTLIK